MKKRFIKIIKKQWLLIWTLAAALTMTTIIASAEYKSATSNMHRVVVSKKGPGMMFSSNYLIQDGDSIYHPIYVKPKGEGEGRYSDNYLYIWNYNTSDIERRYPEDINYTLNVTLTDQSGTPLSAQTSVPGNIEITDPSGTKITLDGNNRSGSFSNQKLIASESAAQNRYTISFSEGWDIDANENICVQIKAVPTTRNSGETYSDLAVISGVVGLKTTSSAISNGWKASISEQPQDGTTTTPAPSAFDGYNLVLTGSGSATIVVKWDTSKLDLNRYFIDEDNRVYNFENGEVVLGETDASGWRTMTIYADTARENRNRYTIQLYKTGTQEPESWVKFFANNKPDGYQESAWIRVNIT